MNLGGDAPLSTFLAAASLVAGASSATAATSVSVQRIDNQGSRLVMATRENDKQFSLADTMAELKRLSGLTWDQLGKFFGVSRRAVHMWANGSPISPEHQSKVESLLTRVRSLAGYRPFEVKSIVLAESATLIPPTLEPQAPILTSDRTPFKHHLKVTRTSTMKVASA